MLAIQLICGAQVIIYYSLAICVLPMRSHKANINFNESGTEMLPNFRMVCP